MLKKRVTCPYCGLRYTPRVIGNDGIVQCKRCSGEHPYIRPEIPPEIPIKEAICQNGHYFYINSRGEPKVCPLCGETPARVTRDMSMWRLHTKQGNEPLRDAVREIIRNRDGSCGPYVYVGDIVGTLTSDQRYVPLLEKMSLQKIRVLTRSVLIQEGYARYSYHSKAWGKKEN